jgi:2-iminobutanoate/2-iminopropanoate deaminase
MKTIIRTGCAPAAIGPYSQAVQAGGFLFVSGQIPLKPDGHLIEGGIAEQAQQVLENLMAIVTAAGGDHSSIVKTTIYLVDLKDFAAVNDVYSSFFGDDPPARATVAVSALPKDSCLEIDAIACLG